MAKEEAIVVPVIDLANSPSELKKLGGASTELGCFRVINHGLPLSLQAEMKEITRSLFHLPDGIKRRNVIHGMLDGGHIPLNTAPNAPFFEAFGIYDAASPTDVRSFCHLLDVSPHQGNIVADYFAMLHGVVDDVACKVAESLGLAGCSFKAWCCHGRLISYNFKSQEDIGTIGAPIHTDSGFLTVLQEDECVGGLQLIDANGNFVSVDDPLPGSLFVAIGDVGKAWSNGRLHNVKHRVVCKKAMPRISIVMFLQAPKSGNIEVEAAFIDSDHPKSHANFIFHEYRNQRGASRVLGGELLPVLKNASN